ncbi:MAG: hypothetical protein ACYSTT_13875, partial [Planctomycetota bacterium]
QAKSYAAITLNEAAGPDAERLFAALHDETVDEETKELLWSGIGGTAREKMADAQTYKTKIVENAKANADYLKRLLPEYKLRPKLVVQKIYLDAMKRIFANAKEKYIVQSAEGDKGGELRVRLSRDPLLKKKKKEEEQTTEADR